MSWPAVERSGVWFTEVRPDECHLWSCPALYLLEVQSLLGNVVLYVGQTSNVAMRLAPSHEHWSAAKRRGMNAVLLHAGTHSDAERLRLETRLRGIYDPPLNKQGSPIADAFEAAFGGQPKGLGLGLLDAFDNTPRHR